MIDHYSFGSMSIFGKQYRSDLKIINGKVIPDWWRKTGHTVDVDDVTEILSSKPDYVVFGSGIVIEGALLKAHQTLFLLSLKLNDTELKNDCRKLMESIQRKAQDPEFERPPKLFPDNSNGVG